MAKDNLLIFCKKSLDLAIKNGWVLTYNSSDLKIAREKLQRLKIHATQETKKLLRIYGKISKW